MKERDWRWEALRLLVGFGMVVGFGWMLWKKTLEPALERAGDGSGVRLKAQEKFLEWSHERHMERRKKEVLEEEKRRREQEASKVGEPASAEGSKSSR
jgi:hypothetical protein